MVCTSPSEALAAQSISLFTAQLAAEIAAGLAPQLSWATRKSNPTNCSASCEATCAPSNIFATAFR